MYWYFICSNKGMVWLVQVETSSEILLVNTAYVVMIVHKIVSADTMCNVAKNCSKLTCTGFLFWNNLSLHTEKVTMEEKF
jgi:hypothetical protein